MKNQKILKIILQDIENGNGEKYEAARELVKILIFHTHFKSEAAHEKATTTHRLLDIVVQFSQATNRLKKNVKTSWFKKYTEEARKDLLKKLEAAAENGNIELLEDIVKEEF